MLRPFYTIVCRTARKGRVAQALPRKGYLSLVCPLWPLCDQFRRYRRHRARTRLERSRSCGRLITAIVSRHTGSTDDPSGLGAALQLGSSIGSMVWRALRYRW